MLDLETWLTCEDRKLYCFPCLVAGVDVEPWTGTGFSNFSYLKQALDKHRISREHVKNAADLKMFLLRNDPSNAKNKENIASYSKSREEQNKQTLINRSFVERLFDTVIHLGAVGFAFRGNDESAESDNKGGYQATLELIEKWRPIQDQIKKRFKGTSHDIQNELIKISADEVLDVIKNRIKDSPFFTITADEATDVARRQHMSVVLRYLWEGEAVESCVGFHNVTGCRGAADLAKIVLEIITLYGTEKCVGQAYDGASLMSGIHAGLQALIRKEVPMASYTHCMAHRLNLALGDSIGNSIECTRFFSTLKSLASFFHSSPLRSDVLKCSHPPTSSETRWSYRSRAVSHVIVNREHLIETFQTIISGDFDAASKSQAAGFIRQMEEFEFIFISNALHDVLQSTNVLFKELQSVKLNISSAVKAVERELERLEKVAERFDELFRRTGGCTEREKRAAVPGTLDAYVVESTLGHRKTGEDHWREIYGDLIWSVVTEIGGRFEDLSNFSFVNILDKSCNIKNMIRLLKDSPYGEMFNTRQLELDLVYYRTSELGPDPATLVKVMWSRTLYEEFPELYKLCQLVITLPVTSVGCERTFSSLKRIKTRLRNRMSDERLSSLCVLEIESKIAHKLNREELVDIFAGPPEKPKKRYLNLRLV